MRNCRICRTGTPARRCGHDGQKCPSYNHFATVFSRLILGSIRVFRLLLLSTGLIGPALAADADNMPPNSGGDGQLRDKVAKLVEQLDSDRFEARRLAAVRLEELVSRPELGRLLSAEFQRVLIRADVSFEVRWHLEKWYRRLPEVPPDAVDHLSLEDASPEQLDRLIRQLDDDSYSVRLGTLRRLKWLLFQDEHLPRVKRALRSRLADGTDAETAVQLRRLLELTRPAMVAEYWRARHHEGKQHLLVGVPSMSPGAICPSHFDRIDDEVAHCVSGNNLSPGDYPVGVAFPHPRQSGSFFHLVNLPTPRQRLEYKIHVGTNEAQRLAAISRRTLDRILAEKRTLDEQELIMLGQLDPEELARFVGKYFRLVEDQPLPHPQPSAAFLRNRTGGRPSRFGMICVWLATDACKDAAPGLLEAIEESRFRPPTSLAPYRLHWLAALSIAVRDPWPEVDAWLADRIGDNEVLVDGRPDGPELGATAAAVLLRRRGQAGSQFGLQGAADPLMQQWGIDGYRFSSDDARENLQQWWEQQRPHDTGV